LFTKLSGITPIHENLFLINKAILTRLKNHWPLRMDSLMARLQNCLVDVDGGRVVEGGPGAELGCRRQFVHELVALAHLEVCFFLDQLSLALTFHPPVHLLVLSGVVGRVHGEGKGVAVLKTSGLGDRLLTLFSTKFAVLFML